MERLILFDIDGTILSTGGAGKWAMLDALKEVFGRDAPHEGYRMSGKTDTQICLELMTSAGLSEEEVRSGLNAVWAAYVSGMRRRLSDGFEAKVHPGVREAIQRLHGDPRALLGLLTGNIRAGATVKLRAVGLDGYFRTGAFGDDHHDRRRLADIALERGQREAGRTFKGKEIVVVGDTPNDILCGQHLGVRTLIVATGTYAVSQLRPYNPDHLFETLADTDRVMDAIFTAQKA
jgi:phosphoglycolate phosphatase-like HAD superfamily hydrolase